MYMKEKGNKNGQLETTMFKVHSYARQNDSECRKWKVYRGFTLHVFSYVWLLTK